jgi:hypothetical protein
VSRAQSEAVATVLLLALVVLLVSTVGYVVLGTIGPDDTPTVEVAATVTDNDVTLTHRSGEGLPGDDLTVVLRYGGSEQRYDFATDGRYGADDTFDPGEEWHLDEPIPYAPGDRVDVLLLHDPSNTVLFRGRKVAATPTATATPAPDVVEWEYGDGGGGGGGGGGADVDGGGGGADVDGGGGGAAGPSIKLRIDDLTDRDRDRPYYVVSYDVTPANDSFESVEVEFGSEERHGTVTETDTGDRGSATYTENYGANAEHTITVRTYYADGDGGTVVGQARTIDDTADTDNPVEEDLSEADSPSVDPSTTISDRSNPKSDKLWYRFDYVIGTNGNFQRTLLGVINRNGNGATVRESRPQSMGSVDLRDDYGTGTEYKITILVFDDAGVVVDDRTLIDEADGN